MTAPVIIPMPVILCQHGVGTADRCYCEATFRVCLLSGEFLNVCNHHVADHMPGEREREYAGRALEAERPHVGKVVA